MEPNQKVTPIATQAGQQRQRQGKERESINVSQKRSDRSGGFDPGSKIASIDASTFASGKGGGALRSIDQTFKVNANNGTLSLSFPLQITQARNNFQPSLSLSYNSGSGNGPFGIGWGLSLETISRKTSKCIPRYDSTDTFILSGLDDLVPIQDHFLDKDGHTVRKFRPRVEQGGAVLRIEQWTSRDDINDVHWRTIDHSNIVKIYGRTDQSRVFETTVSGTSHIFSWLLCEAYDPLGNAMKLSYKAEDDEGILSDGANTPDWELQRPNAIRTRARYIKSIKYGNCTPSRDLESWSIIPAGDVNEWMFEVVFDYGDHEFDTPATNESAAWKVRKDPFSSCASGFEVRSYRLCRRILMFHHHEKELHLKDYLVSSYSFDYDESPRGSLLASTTLRGHVWGTTDEKESYIVQSLAPCAYEYTLPGSISEQLPQTIKPRAFQMLPITRQDATMRWIDLHGEGSQGILLQLDGTWYYQRNESAVSDSDETDDEEWPISDNFGAFGTVDLHPNVAVQEGSYFADIDGNGHQDLVVSDEQGRLHGYFECTEEDQWSLLHEFSTSVNINNEFKNLQRIDLTGNGRTDIVFPGPENGEVLWHESLGKLGFASERRSQNHESLPELVFRDPRSSIYLADANGDGLTDVIKLSNGRVSYWPNLGYGKFGMEVVMGNCPVFDSDNDFTTQRIRLLDLDGSGTCDVLYLLPQGGAVAYHNFCGNSWSDGVFIGIIPKFDGVSDVFTSDLLGKGTSCLCWTSLEGGDSPEYVISFIDLGGAAKPNLLKSWSNGIGTSTSITYRPSTKLYLQDEKLGRAWKTKLPFPVHTVSRTVEKDEVIGSTRTTKYLYHEGYYDGIEREFRGFGEVDRWESEEFLLIHGTKKYKKPTCYTKLWYHTGAEQVGLAPSDSTTFDKVRLQCKFPTDLHSRELRDAYRALNGTQLRAEIYGDDHTDQAENPYTVEESSYDLILTSPHKGDTIPATFRVQAREKLSFQYERGKTDARISHDLTVQTNAYGDATRTVHVEYGRDNSPLMDPQLRADQEAHSIKWIETAYTNTIDESNAFRKPMVASIKAYYVTNSPQKELLDLEKLRNSGLSAIAGTIQPGEETRTYYKSQDLSGSLLLGELETFSVVDQQYQLAMDRSMYEEAYGKNDVAFSKFTLDGLLSQHCAFADLDTDKSAWIPSHCSLYGDEGIGKDELLKEARKSFFVPSGSIDPFGNIARVEMDEFGLLPVKSVDAAGNVTEAKNDYRVMQSSTVTDPNKNRIEVAYDGLGHRTALASMGKLGEKVGDSLEDVTTIISNERLLAFILDPSREEAARLLGKSSNRWLSCNIRKTRSPDELPLPTFHISLARTEHAEAPSQGRNTFNDILVQITYLDGRERVTQQLSLACWDDAEAQWCVSTHKVSDANGNTVASLTPYSATNTEYASHFKQEQPRTIHFLDALDRNVGILNPDHSWTKISLTPWSKIAFDAGDTVMVADPRSDPDTSYFFSTLDSSLFLPSWHNFNLGSGDETLREAATQSASYADKPTTIHFDGRGHEIAVVDRGEGRTRMTRVSYDAFGNKKVEFDALGRIAEKSSFDFLGRIIKRSNMDAGTQVFLLNSLGKVVMERNGRGSQRRMVYDPLLRKTETRTIENGQINEKLWSRIMYGDAKGEAESNNLRGRIFAIHDQSGKRKNLQYDFKGNCLVTTIQLAVEYKTTLDWSQKIDLCPTEYTIRSEYDALNRGIASTDAVGQVSMRSFSLLHGLHSMHTSSGNTQSVQTCHVSNTSYTADGLPLCVDYGNSSHTVYTYDKNTRRLLRRLTWRDDKTILENLSYTYDCLGRVIREKNDAHQTVFFRNNQVPPTKGFWYDDFGRLSKATGRETIEAGGIAGRSLHQVASCSPLARSSVRSEHASELSNFEETYVYDDADNVLKVKHESSDANIMGWTRSYHYSEQSLLESGRCCNRLSSTQLGNMVETYGYEGNAGKVGCMTSMTGYSRLGWDINNKLRCTARQRVTEGTPETTWYVYGEGGERVRKVTDRMMPDTKSDTQPAARKLQETIFLDSAEIYHTYDGDGSTFQTTMQTSLLSDGSSQDQRQIVSIEDYVLTTSKSTKPTGKLMRYHVSQNLEVDDEAQVVSYEEYSPFGVSVLLACRSDIEAPRRHRFAAYLRDHETGLYACGARYYAPWLGRWTSPDPLGTVDGPNVYAYVGNDPVNWFDPKGTEKDKKQRHQDIRANSQLVVGDRRLAIANVESQLDTPEKFSKHIELVQQKILDSRSLKEKAKDYFVKNKEKFARKVLTYLIAESLGLVPLAGAGLKYGVNSVSDAWENHLDVQERKKEIRDALALGFHYGERARDREAQVKMLGIYHADEAKPGVLKDLVLSVGLYGLRGEAPEPFVSPETNFDELRAPQTPNDTRPMGAKVMGEQARTKQQQSKSSKE